MSNTYFESVNFPLHLLSVLQFSRHQQINAKMELIHNPGDLQNDTHRLNMFSYFDPLLLRRLNSRDNWKAMSKPNSAQKPKKRYLSRTNYFFMFPALHLHSRCHNFHCSWKSTLKPNSTIQRNQTNGTHIAAGTMFAPRLHRGRGSLNYGKIGMKNEFSSLVDFFAFIQVPKITLSKSSDKIWKKQSYFCI